MYVWHLTSVGNYGLLIVWQWSLYTKEDSGSDTSDAEEHTCKSAKYDSLTTDSDVDEEAPVLSTVTFKCIGVTRDSSYQQALQKACKSVQDGHPVR